LRLEPRETRVSGKVASGGLSPFRHPRAHANPRPACVRAMKPAEGLTQSVMDKLDYGLSEPQMVLLKNGHVFLAGQVQAPMDPPPVNQQSQAMRMRVAADVAIPSILTGSTLIGEVLFGPQFISLTFPKCWPEVMPLGSYDFAATTPMQAAFAHLQIVDTANPSTPVWDGYLDDQGRVGFASISSYDTLLDESKTFQFFVLPDVKVDLGSNGTVSAKVFDSGTNAAIPPILVKTQVGGSDLVDQPLLLKVGDTGMNAADIRTASGALNILWTYNEAMQYLATTSSINSSNARSFNDFTYFWNPNINPAGGTHFDSNNGNQIYVNGVQARDSDDMDDAVLLHEFGHKVHFVFGPARGLPAIVPGNHLPILALDPEMAWKEGWAEFFQAAVKASSVYPPGHQATAEFNSQINGAPKDSRLLVDPGPTGLIRPSATVWSNEIWVSTALYQLNSSLGIQNLIPSLNPGVGMDSLNSFVGRLNASMPTATNLILNVSPGFNTPPRPTADIATPLTLRVPSNPFLLFPLGMMPDRTSFEVLEGGSGFFTCPMPPGFFMIQIDNVISNVGIRVVGTGGRSVALDATADAIPVPGTNSFVFHIDASQHWDQSQGLSYLAVYNLSPQDPVNPQINLLQNLVVTVTQ